MSVVKLRKTHTEQQLEDITNFSKDDDSFKLIAIMLFEDEDGETQIAFSLPDGVNYLTLLGAFVTAQDWVLAEMTGEGEMLH